jgi:hypothetical protein
MPGIVDAIKSFITGDPLAGIKGLIEEFHLSPEDKLKAAQFQQELEAKREEIQAARDAELARIQGENIRAETTSQDAYVRRARPTFAYIIEAVIGFNFILLPILQFATGKTPAPILLPTDLLWLFGAWMLGYGGLRSFDKFAALPGESKIDLPFIKASNVSS